MWAKLIEVLIQTWSRSREPRRRLARAVVTLYDSLFNCHAAFLRYRSDATPSNLDEWDLALDALIRTIWSLRRELDIFEPGVLSVLMEYAEWENRAVDRLKLSLETLGVSSPRRAISPKRDDMQQKLELLAAFMGRPQVEGHLLPAAVRQEQEAYSGDFESAIEQLRAFIADSFSMQEIFGAK